MGEAARAASVEGSGIPGTGAEAAFDRLVQLAAAALAAPVALISIVGESRIWREAIVGAIAADPSPEGVFCTHIMRADDLLVVDDALFDPRFVRSALVVKEGMRFFAGAPVRLVDGEAVGALCVLDRHARQGLDPSGRALLLGLAAAAGHLLDLRRELAARHAAERRLSEQAWTLDRAEEMGELASWRFDLRSRRLWHSENARRIYGFASDVALEREDLCLSLYDPADRPRILEAVDEARATAAGYCLDVKLRRASDGSPRDIRIRARVEVDGKGQAIALVGIMQDMTRDKEVLKTLHGRRVEADRLAGELRLLATTDALTGLLNRRAFLEIADAALARGGRVDLVVIDIDHFKSVNDLYGHSVGDLVLAAFGRICAGVAAPAAVGRIGGEEFALLIEGEQPAAAPVLVERLRHTLCVEPWVVGHEFTLSLTLSAGLARSRADDDWSSLFGRADRALYQAKREGRDRISIAA